MVYIVWEFRVKKGKKRLFEKHYSSTGDWAGLFRKSEAYRETVLTLDTETPDRYLVIDIWNDITSFRQFKKQNAIEYEQLDEKCEAYTEEERCVGFFESL